MPTTGAGRGHWWISTPIEDSGACLTVENSWLLKAKQAGQLAPQSPVAQSVDVFEWTPVVGRGQVTFARKSDCPFVSVIYRGATLEQHDSTG